MDFLKETAKTNEAKGKISYDPSYNEWIYYLDRLEDAFWNWRNQAIDVGMYARIIKSY